MKAYWLLLKGKGIANTSRFHLSVKASFSISFSATAYVMVSGMPVMATVKDLVLAEALLTLFFAWNVCLK